MEVLMHKSEIKKLGKKEPDVITKTIIAWHAGSSYHGDLPSLSIFKRIISTKHPIASVRAPEIMNTKSETEFQWSVELTGTRLFHVGIATTLQRSKEHICKYDFEAIYYSSGGYVCDGRKTIQVSDKNHEDRSGDVISFKFQPQSKKLYVQLSSLGINDHSPRSFTVKDNINYFPFVQLIGIYAREVKLIAPVFKNKK